MHICPHIYGAISVDVDTYTYIHIYIYISIGTYQNEYVLNYDRDYLLDYFGFKTLERAYLMKINKKIVERPQHMWMRVAIGVHGNDLKRAKTLLLFDHPNIFSPNHPKPIQKHPQSMAKLLPTCPKTHEKVTPT